MDPLSAYKRGLEQQKAEEARAREGNSTEEQGEVTNKREKGRTEEGTGRGK